MKCHTLLSCLPIWPTSNGIGELNVIDIGHPTVSFLTHLKSRASLKFILNWILHIEVIDALNLKLGKIHVDQCSIVLI